jgi:hypothetical protein
MSVYQTQLRPPSRLTSALAGKVDILEQFESMIGAQRV